MQNGRSPRQRESGVARIEALFERLRAQRRAALMPYLTLGYPAPERSLQLVAAAVAGGADMLELGVPFSDPLADGPVIQRATHMALQQGTTVAGCMQLARDLRERGIMVPFIFMGYYNPILAYGEEAYCRDCAGAGVDGLIVPDLPPEEAQGLEAACERHGLALIYLLAPTSTPERVRLVTAHSRGFVSLVSVTGTTGARERLAPGLSEFVGRVRATTTKPLAVGFGISNPAQARQVAGLADGVIVGSALVHMAEAADGPRQVASLVGSLRQAVER